jgi:hypothetical protein
MRNSKCETHKLVAVQFCGENAATCDIILSCGSLFQSVANGVNPQKAGYSE